MPVNGRGDGCGKPLNRRKDRSVVRHESGRLLTNHGVNMFPGDPTEDFLDGTQQLIVHQLPVAGLHQNGVKLSVTASLIVILPRPRTNTGGSTPNSKMIGIRPAACVPTAIYSRASCWSWKALLRMRLASTSTKVPELVISAWGCVYIWGDIHRPGRQCQVTGQEVHPCLLNFGNKQRPCFIGTVRRANECAQKMVAGQEVQCHQNHGNENIFTAPSPFAVGRGPLPRDLFKQPANCRRRSSSRLSHAHPDDGGVPAMSSRSPGAEEVCQRPAPAPIQGRGFRDH